MGYEMAMKMSGAVVHEFAHFGSYQGDWYAVVDYQGKRGFVHGAFGSCSYCDAFAAEFEDTYHEVAVLDEESAEKGKAVWVEEYHSLSNLSDDCPKCREIQARLVAFGEGYLEGLMSGDEALRAAGKNVQWDMDAVEMYEWVLAKVKQYGL